MRMDTGSESSVGVEVRPRDNLEFLLAGIFEDLLGRSSVSVEDSFFDLGGHSFLAVQLIARIKKDIGRSIPLAALFDEDAAAGPSVAFLAGLLRDSARSGEDFSPLVVLRRGDRQRPVFLIHPTGGELICYRPLLRRLDEDWRVLGICAPPIAAPDEVVTIEDLAASHVEHVLSVRPDGDCVLVGWSMGGVLAFEMARQLVKAGRRVDRLVLVDSYLTGPDDRFDDADMLFDFADGLVRHVGLDPTGLADLQLAGLSYWDGLERVRDFIRSRDGWWDAHGADSLVERLHLHRAHVRALNEYQPRGTVGQLTLIQAADQEPSRRDAAARRWQDLVDTPIDHLVTPGDHHGALAEPQVSVLADHLVAVLGGADEHR